ncbi:hypothetical protein HUG20_07535 [Salicibibacter cibi]|uniref:YqhG family protein n=1 Tax=Salicibibacter cibi TaxID=2743001 RepID=A0A7T6ZAK9_9BACI|nr:YqhG family protein [Salicibibacter cibi]QQK79750.1 hypothetical protein HUG20_07535 [Salicibibacter cibi]
MEQAEVHNYLRRFFHAGGAGLLQNTPSKLEVQLNKMLDLELMNRPFYWHYLEKTGGEPKPLKLNLSTDIRADTPSAEKVHFGSPRLHQIFSSAAEKGAVTRLYENHHEKNQTPLYPWLGLNVRISYTCHRRRDIIRSFGIQLISGETIDLFMKRLAPLPLVSAIPDYTFTMAHLIQPMSAVQRIKKYLLNDIRNQKHAWANEATNRMEDDLALLDRFYETSDKENDDAYSLEKEAIHQQYQPAIELTFINGGIFYLRKDTY